MWTPFVMLICLAGLRSIPDYIYEAAEVDRASKWRQFWTITVPMVLPFLMLAVLFRGIENFKMFDMVALLTGGGPGSTTTRLDHLKREAFEKWRTGYSSAFAIILFVTVFGLANDLRQGPEQGEGKMSNLSSSWSVTEPSRLSKWVAGVLVVVYTVITLCRWSGSSRPASSRRRTASPTRRRSVRAVPGRLRQPLHHRTRVRRPRNTGPAAARDLV
jgi:ABC-type Fe3+ transport system permease subunit